MSLPFRFSDQNFAHISDLYHVCCILHPSFPPLFDHPNTFVFNKLQVMMLPILFFFLPPNLLSLPPPSLLDLNMLFNTLKHPSLHSLLDTLSLILIQSKTPICLYSEDQEI